MGVVESPSFPVSYCVNRTSPSSAADNSGVGTRDYYRRLGYFLDGPYMVKDLLYDDDE